MMSENTFLWSCVWQSTVCILVGLVLSFALRRWPARAHRVLFLAIVAAVVVPLMSAGVKRFGWGLLKPKPVVVVQEEFVQATVIEPVNYELTRPIVFEDTGSYEKPVEVYDEAEAVVVQEPQVIPWRQLLLWAWITASVFLIVRLVVSIVFGVRLLARGVPLECAEIERALGIAKRKLGIEKNVLIYCSEKVRSPVIWCWRREPVLLLPMAAGREGAIDWVSVFCHELGHWKRWDHVSGLLAEIVVCVFPWNPLFWWAKRRLVGLSEQACDDWVVSCCQESTDYADSLLGMASQRQMAFAPAVVSSKKGLGSRIRRILEDRCGNPRAGVRWALAVSLVAVVGASVLAFAQTRPVETGGQADLEVEVGEESEGPFARVVAEIVVDGLRGQRLGFVSESRLAEIGKEIETLVAEKTADDLPKQYQDRLLASLKKYVPGYFPNTKNQYEWTYLCFEDRIATLKWKLSMAVGRGTLDSQESQRLQEQRQWIESQMSLFRERRTLSHAQAFEKLNALYLDPLRVGFLRPMTEQEFSRFVELAQPRPNDRRLSIHYIKSLEYNIFRALCGPKSKDTVKVFGSETVGYGQGGGKFRLRFASNRAFVGNNLSFGDVKTDRSVLDASTGRIINVPESASGDLQLERWLDKEGKGDFIYDNSDGGAIVACRDAKLAVLEVSNWIEADAISGEMLSNYIRGNVVHSVSLKKYREISRNDYDFIYHGQPFIAVETKQGGLAVARVTDFGGDDVTIRTRVRGSDVGVEGQIGAIIGEFWQTLDSGDFGGLFKYYKASRNKKSVHIITWWTSFNQERKQLLSRGIDIAKIDKVVVNGEEALAMAVGQVTEGRPLWYYLRRDEGKWFIRTSFDCPAGESVDLIFTIAREQPGDVKIEYQESKAKWIVGEVMKAFDLKGVEQVDSNSIVNSVIVRLDANDFTRGNRGQRVEGFVNFIRTQFDPNKGEAIAIAGFSNRKLFIDIYDKNANLSAETGWGEVVKGLQLGLAFDGEVRAYQLGEVVSFKIFVRNVVDEEISWAYEDLRHSMPKLRGNSDRPIIYCGGLLTGSGTNISHRLSLRPRESKLLGKVRLRLGSTQKTRGIDWAIDLGPGQYRVWHPVTFGNYEEVNLRVRKLTTGKLKLTVEEA
ncbi:MAG: M56 family metallopeptidase, partial [Planctomycetota bacterium]